MPTAPPRAGGICALFAKVLIEESRKLREMLLGFRRIRVSRVLGMRLPLKHVQLRVDAHRAKLAMHPHRIAEEQEIILKRPYPAIRIASLVPDSPGKKT